MGQLCCYPFGREEKKISDKKGAEPDDAELLSLSKKLVEAAVLKAVQQYLEETQNKNIQNDCGTPVKTEEVAIGNSKERKSPETVLVKEALHKELLPLLAKVNQIRELLSRPSIRMKIYKELLEQGQLS